MLVVGYRVGQKPQQAGPSCYNPAMDGDRDKDPHWSTGPSSQGPDEEQKEEEHEQESEDLEGYVHPQRPCD